MWQEHIHNRHNIYYFLANIYPLSIPCRVFPVCFPNCQFKNQSVLRKNSSVTTMQSNLFLEVVVDILDWRLEEEGESRRDSHELRAVHSAAGCTLDRAGVDLWTDVDERRSAAGSAVLGSWPFVVSCDWTAAEAAAFARSDDAAARYLFAAGQALSDRQHFVLSSELSARLNALPSEWAVSHASAAAAVAHLQLLRPIVGVFRLDQRRSPPLVADVCASQLSAMSVCNACNDWRVLRWHGPLTHAYQVTTET